VIFNRLQVLLRHLSPGGGSSKLHHEGVDLGDCRFVRRQRACLSYFEGPAPSDTSRGIVGTLADITERKDREEREHFLMREG
jgi:hypothetical protein